jgi:hypothetical protein
MKLGIGIHKADMHYWETTDEKMIGKLSYSPNIEFDSNFYYGAKNGKIYHYMPCWTLSALLEVLPKSINNEALSIKTSAALWHIGYQNAYTVKADNPVDACYQLIVYLHELKML